jgi:hypothetical protein
MEYHLLPNKPRVLEGNNSTSIILYQNSWIIAKFNENVILTGQYAYPFDFILPTNLPGSFEYYDENNTAYIKYILTVKLISLEIKEKDVSSSALLIVRQSSRSLEYPTQLSNVKNIRNWCCINQGFSTLNIAYPKNHYHPEESVKIICTVDNTRCRVDTNIIKLQLIQNISMKDSRNNHKFLCRKVGEQVYKGTLPRGQSNTRILEITLADIDNPTLRNIDKCDHKYLFKDTNMISKLQATTYSQLINCKYYLKVSVGFDGVYCSETPQIQIPIIIYIPDVRYDVLSLKPNNWDPITLPGKTLDLPTAEQLGLNNFENIRLRN